MSTLKKNEFINKFFNNTNEDISMEDIHKALGTAFFLITDVFKMLSNVPILESDIIEAETDEDSNISIKMKSTDIAKLIEDSDLVQYRKKDNFKVKIKRRKDTIVFIYDSI